EEADTEIRFRLVDSLREFAEAQLDDRDVSELTNRHSGYFEKLAETAARQADGERQTECLDRLERDSANLRAVLTREVDRKSGIALAIVANLWRFWQCHGHYEEGRKWLEIALESDLDTSGVEPSVRAKAHSGAGALAWNQGDFEAAEAHYAKT